MGEVIGTLSAEEKGRYMPFCEVSDRGLNEAYELAGAYLMLVYKVDGEVTTPGDFLIELSSGEKVTFPYGGYMNIDALRQEVDS